MSYAKLLRERAEAAQIDEPRALTYLEYQNLRAFKQWRERQFQAARAATSENWLRRLLPGIGGRDVI